MRKPLILLVILCLMILPSAVAEPVQEDMLLHLSFDEGSGSVIRDISGHLPDGNVQYQYLAPAWTEPMDPQWRRIGVEGGSLLFDGCSTCIAGPASDLCLAGSSLTVSAFNLPSTI